MPTLDELALSLPDVPDKSSQGHGYLEHYEQFFAPWRDKSVRLLEIGVAQGHSLVLWSRYFPLASIVGCDIDLKRCKQPLPDRVRLWEADQRSAASLVNMVNNLGDFDIIIDDGSHNSKDQVLTFDTLWPHLAAGGIYAIEDLHVNYFAEFTPAMVRYIGGQLQDELHGRGKTRTALIANSPADEQAKLSGREREIKAIHLYRYLAIIEKR